jgi:hypothetical protein
MYTRSSEPKKYEFKQWYRSEGSLEEDLDREDMEHETLTLTEKPHRGKRKKDRRIGLTRTCGSSVWKGNLKENDGFQRIRMKEKQRTRPIRCGSGKKS